MPIHGAYILDGKTKLLFVMCELLDFLVYGGGNHLEVERATEARKAVVAYVKAERERLGLAS